MKIQPINIMCKPNKPCFTENKRRQNIDRTATVADLYEMEDRIYLKNKELINQQNRKIGNILMNLTKMIYSNDYYFYDRALDTSKDLSHSDI